MIRKILALVLSLTFLSNSVFARGQEALKIAFDDFVYEVTVEGKNMESAREQLLKDVKASGATSEEILNFAKSEIKDEKIAKDFETIMKMVRSNQISPEDAQARLVFAIEKSQMRGASWDSGDTVKAVVLPLFLILPFLIIGLATADI